MKVEKEATIATYITGGLTILFFILYIIAGTITNWRAATVIILLITATIFMRKFVYWLDSIEKEKRSDPK